MLKEFVNDKIMQHGELLRMVSLTNQYEKLKLSYRLKVNLCVNKNPKTQLIFLEKVNFLKKTAETVYGKGKKKQH